MRGIRLLLVKTYSLETPFQPPSDVDMSKMDVVCCAKIKEIPIP